MLAGVAVGYADLFGLLSFVVVATVQMKRGGIEVNALCGNAKALGGLAGDPDEELGEISFKEFVQDPPQPVVV
jgi:hypothetical protein